MIPLEKVKDILDKHSKLEGDLSSADIDKKKFAEMSKEYADLNDIIDDAKFYSSFDTEKKELEKMSKRERALALEVCLTTKAKGAFLILHLQMNFGEQVWIH